MQCNTLVTFVHSMFNERVLTNDISVVHEPLLLLDTWRCLRLLIWIILCTLKTHIKFISIVNTVNLINTKMFLLNNTYVMNGKLRISHHASMNQMYRPVNVNCRCASKASMNFLKFWHFSRGKNISKNDMFFENFLIKECNMLLTRCMPKILHIEALLKILVVIPKSALRAHNSTWLCLLFDVYGALSRSKLVMKLIPFQCVSPYIRFENVLAKRKRNLAQKHILIRIYMLLSHQTYQLCNIEFTDYPGIIFYINNMRKRYLRTVFLYRGYTYIKDKFIMIMIYMLPNG